MEQDELIWVSDLHNQAFCEYEIYLREILQIPDPGAPALDEGREIHAGLDSQSMLASQATTIKRLAEGKPIPESVPEIVQIAKDEKITYVTRDLFVVGKRLKGRIDQVDFAPARIYIIDDKPPSHTGRPYITETRQTQGYCLAFSQQYALGLPLVAVIRDKYTGEEIWSKLFTPEDAISVNESIDRIIGIIKGTWNPQDTQNPRKCCRCRWHPVCPKNKCREITTRR